MKIAYQNRDFSSATLKTIDTANAILAEYQTAGYDITLRQLYYQFVARGLIANKDTEYKRLGSIISDARLAGLVDWNSIVDRTRNLEGLAHWDSPEAIIDACASQYRRDKWATQPFYVEVWVEKDALKGVIGQAATALDVSYFSCRGYTSQSELWGAAMRLMGKLRAGKHVRVIHLGDHDPSGKDMTRDIEDRLNLFVRHHIGPNADRLSVMRIALNMDQVEQFNPPPNPAKIADSRASAYIAEFGGESWELDALDPATLNTLITESVRLFRDEELWQAQVEQERQEKAALEAVSGNWNAIVEEYGL